MDTDRIVEIHLRGRLQHPDSDADGTLSVVFVDDNGDRVQGAFGYVLPEWIVGWPLLPTEPGSIVVGAGGWPWVRVEGGWQTLAKDTDGEYRYATDVSIEAGGFNPFASRYTVKRVGY